MRASAWARRIQDHVRGTDAVTGCPYAEGDPNILLWVHEALVDSVLAAGTLVGTAAGWRASGSPPSAAAS
jgi:uncharacterized protein (DUF2236 family)